MKTEYQKPLTRWVDMEAGEPVLVVVSRVTGTLSDGTNISDGGEDDGSATAAVKSEKNLWDDLWE